MPFRPMGSDSPLSARERSVVQLIAEGHSNKKIASILNLSVKDRRDPQGNGSP